MRTNVAAYTDPVLASDALVVPYVSINQEETGLVSVTVRNTAGVEASVSMPVERYFDLVKKQVAATARWAGAQ